MNKLIRDFENTKYFGYMFFIEYDGQKFESFDENHTLTCTLHFFLSIDFLKKLYLHEFPWKITLTQDQAPHHKIINLRSVSNRHNRPLWNHE